MNKFNLETKYEKGDDLTVTIKGKEVPVKFVLPYVVQKTPTVYYTRDCVSGKWMYTSPSCLAGRVKRGIDFTQFKGRATKNAELAASGITKVKTVKTKETKPEPTTPTTLVEADEEDQKNDFEYVEDEEGFDKDYQDIDYKTVNMV